VSSHRVVRIAPRSQEAEALVIGTLALGIAATTVVFSLADAILWHPLPFRGEDRLVRVRVGPRAGAPLFTNPLDVGGEPGHIAVAPLGKKAVEAKDWARAIQFLSRAEVQDDRNPDLENLLGYAYRNVGRFDEAFRHYRAALRLNPRHRGAHEYIGEAYLLTGNVAQAEQHLAELQKLCSPIPCEQLKDLRRAVDEYKKTKK
jgi:tetratricopeptide (TPR) repeat protein